MKYSDDQPRDELGRWTSEGGSPTARAWAAEGERLGLTSIHDEEKNGAITVYHGLAEGHTREGFLFVTRDKAAAGFHGRVSSFKLKPGARIYADIETDKKRTGHQTLIAPKASESSGIVHIHDLVAHKFAWDDLAKAADGKTPDDIAREADLSAIDEIIADLADEMGASAEQVSTEVLARIGVDSREELVDVVNDRAVAKARDIAAEMVGMRFDEDGELVPARREAWRIDETTRDMIRDTIADGLEENLGNEEIARLIEESTGFSAARAELIAHTEIARINSMASLESYKGARDDLGLKIKKEWLLGEHPCEICQANNEQGPIDLDDEFESGDDAPPAHPNCECAVSPVMVDDEEETAPSDEESPNSEADE